MPNTERISEKNIISFIAHCDEKNCHIHATITPILEDGRLSAKDMFGGGSLVAARDKMREWHDWYAAVNEKWGLERGDDIHETGARHKSLEEHNRELHRENKLNDMPWRDKDEDYLHWAYRAMRYAHAKHYPDNRLKRSLSK